MTDATPKTLEDILETVFIAGQHYERGGELSVAELTKEDEATEIRSLIKEAIPKEATSRGNDIDEDNFMPQDEADGFNQAIDKITANLKSKGLL